MKSLQTLTLLAAAFVLTPSTARSGTITLTPDQFIHVSLDGDRDSPGTVDAGALSTNTYFVRERADAGQEALRIALFLSFDSGLLSSPALKSATFEAEFTERLNTINDLAVEVGRVQDDGTNGDTWDDSLAAGTVPLFEWGMSSAMPQTVVPNVRTNALNTFYSADVTSIVEAWRSGSAADNGLVLYGDRLAFQGAGFENVRLQATFIPEPATAGLLAVATLTLLRRRR